MLVLGSRWMIVDDPWLLDKVANEERLKMTFEEFRVLIENNGNIKDYPNID